MPADGTETQQERKTWRIKKLTVQKLENVEEKHYQGQKKLALTSELFGAAPSFPNVLQKHPKPRCWVAQL